MANVQGPLLQDKPPPYEDIVSIHGPQNAFIPNHAPPPSYYASELRHGALSDEPGTQEDGQTSDEDGFLDFFEQMLRRQRQNAGDETPLDVTSDEQSRLLGRDVDEEAGRLGREPPRLVGPRSRRNGRRVDNPLHAQLLRRRTSANSCIHRLNIFIVLLVIPLTIVGTFQGFGIPNSLTTYFAAVILFCMFLFLLSSVSIGCWGKRISKWGPRLSRVCRVLSVLVMIVYSFSLAQESTYFLTCDSTGPWGNFTQSNSSIITPHLKCPDGTINPPSSHDQIMKRVILQGCGCLLFVIFSLLFSIQLCYIDRFMTYRRMINDRT